jgi:serine protease SohB
MPDALVDYLSFLAKTVTVVLALLALVVVVAVASRRSRPRSRLQVKDLGRRRDRTAAELRAHLVPRKVFKRQLKAERKRRKEEERKAAGAGPDSRRPRVYVLDFHGDVRASRVAALREEITAVLSLATSRDEVVVRLENPGGLVNEQGLAASQLLRVRNHGVPLTVAVDSVAASGGYMMACVASRIVAAPFAVVGSIGVVTQVPNFHRLLDRAGVDVELFTGGEFKRTVTMFGRNTDADREKLREQIEDTHALFKEFVGEHRPQVDLARVATGEYWYGARALELRLVDELVTSDDYLTAARERADVYELRYHPPRSVRRAVLSAARNLLRIEPGVSP